MEEEWMKWVKDNMPEKLLSDMRKANSHKMRWRDEYIKELKKTILKTMNLIATETPSDGIIWYDDMSTLYEHLASVVRYTGEVGNELNNG